MSEHREETPSPEEPGANAEDVARRIGANAGIERRDDGQIDVLKTIGGVRGLIESLLPGLVFLVIFTIWQQLNPALIASVAVAVAFTVARLVRRGTLTQALTGLAGRGHLRDLLPGHRGSEGLLRPRLLHESGLWRGAGGFHPGALAADGCHLRVHPLGKHRLARQRVAHQGLRLGHLDCGGGLRGAAGRAGSAVLRRQRPGPGRRTPGHGRAAVCRRTLGCLDGLPPAQPRPRAAIRRRTPLPRRRVASCAGSALSG